MLSDVNVTVTTLGGMVAMLQKIIGSRKFSIMLLYTGTCMKFVDCEALSKRREVGKYNTHVAFLSIKNGAKLSNFILY
jgi:hypothetical protein